MQALAAFWKFMFVQTQARSALFTFIVSRRSTLYGLLAPVVQDVLGRAASSGGSSGRAVDDAGIDTDLSVGRESRGGEDEERDADALVRVRERRAVRLGAHGDGAADEGAARDDER